MPYVGKTPVVGNFVKLDAIVTSATATYNLLNGGVAYFPQTANNCIVSLNGVIQSPTSAYTISGSTIVFDSALTSADSIDFILVLGDVLSIGTPSDGTVTSAKLASGLSGLISWQSVQTTGFTASAGRGYPCNTTSAAFTVTLPASPSVGDTIILLDYAGTFATNNITLGANSNKINGVVANKMITTAREAVTLTYVDSTQGWVASSGTNFGTQSLDPVSYSADFLVIAGGGSGGFVGSSGNRTGGAGAGGYRNSYSTETSGGGGSSESSLTFIAGTVYTITVGAGGASATSIGRGNTGIDSSISGTGITTITSAGGGAGGGGGSGQQAGGNGGSGGGAGDSTPGLSGGSGTANQGYAGGSSSENAPGYNGGGGGGAGAVGSNGSSTVAGAGGNGLASSITGSSVTRAGGGGAAFGYTNNNPGASGGTGGGGAGANSGGSASNGTANTGSGGGGGADAGNSGAGGSGVVILRMPTANYSGTTTGSPTVTTSGADTILVYNASGTYTG
jgi:hypothetical protein